MSEPRILLQQMGPNGNIQATVEDDGRSVHLYLGGDEDSDWPIRSCWVRNLKTAPALFEAERMQQGLQPMLPARYCAHPDGAAPLREEDLELLWFEEGDSVALLERGEVLAVIPPWEAASGVAGYSRDCVLEGPLATPLGSPQHDHHGVFQRLVRAAQFWESWDHNPWPAIQDGLMKAYEAKLGAHAAYLSTPPEHFPPRSLTRFDTEEAIVFATGGMSLRPQPQVERHIDDRDHRLRIRRIELALAWPAPVDDPGPLLGYLDRQATLPWDRWTFLDEGHTIGLSSSLAGDRFVSVALWRDPPGAPRIELPPFAGEPVHLLWMVPIDAEEQAIAKEQGGPALLEALRQKNADWIRRRG